MSMKKFGRDGHAHQGRHEKIKRSLAANNQADGTSIPSIEDILSILFTCAIADNAFSKTLFRCCSDTFADAFAIDDSRP